MHGQVRYEPPQLVPFGGAGQIPVGFGFTCSSGPKASDATCSAGWTAANKCGSGCTAQTVMSCTAGVTVKGCGTGYSANACSTGTTGPYFGYCELSVCCSGSGGSNWSTCKTGDENMSGACKGGSYACGEACLTYDLCNPPS